MKVKTSEFRPTIIRMLERGKGVREIARDLGISPGTVTKAKQRFEETGSNKDRPKGKPKKICKKPAEYSTRQGHDSAQPDDEG